MINYTLYIAITNTTLKVVSCYDFPNLLLKHYLSNAAIIMLFSLVKMDLRSLRISYK